MSVLSIDRLSLSIREKPILSDVSFDVQRGKVTGLIGESGSGKSLTALSIMQLLPNGSAVQGSIRFEGTEILKAGESTMCRLRGDDIGMIFQEPMTALNPLKTIGEQVAEGIRLHRGSSRYEAEQKTIAILDRVGLSPERFPLSRYPHELSGGQRQRVGIAIACALEPALLIADEPTTALDVIVQAQILELLNELVDDRKMGLLLISHDLGVVARHADELVILKNGMVVESGDCVTVLTERKHPYTRQLAEASTHVPPSNNSAMSPAEKTIANLKDVTVSYMQRRKSIFRKPPPFEAVRNVSISIAPGEIVGLVGESGCGKSSLARALLGLQPIASGSIDLSGNGRVGNPSVQAVFQDPYGSFNPRKTARWIISEAFYQTGGLTDEQREMRLLEAVLEVGLEPNDLEKYPHEFSGGQRQRLAIARAIANYPQLIIADEPVSALDVSIRARILDLISGLRTRLGIGWLFVSHDLAVVKGLCDRILVMRNGRIIEQGTAEQVYENPQESYTRKLIAAAPDLEAAIADRLSRL